MIKIKAPYPKDIVKMFDKYTHNIPVIYSVIEGQYEGCIYVDNPAAPGYALLYTPFMFCYVTGDPDIAGIGPELDALVFKEILPDADAKEIIIFSPSGAWDRVLKQVFEAHHGFCDGRRLFEFDPDGYAKAKEKYHKQPDGIRLCVKDTNDGSVCLKPYPSAQLWLGDVCVCRCSAIMLGAGRAELDIETLPEHQGKGYGTFAAISLIDELLRRSYVPCWSTWPYREASLKLAQKIGFVRLPDTPAFIWTEQDCGKL